MAGAVVLVEQRLSRQTSTTAPCASAAGVLHAWCLASMPSFVAVPLRCWSAPIVPCWSVHAAASATAYVRAVAVTRPHCGPAIGCCGHGAHPPSASVVSPIDVASLAPRTDQGKVFRHPKGTPRNRISLP